MPDNLAEQLLDTGLLHFGRFQNGAEAAPFRFDLEYLPAYPDVLRNLVTKAQVCLGNLACSPLHSAKRPCGMGEGQGGED